jgi:regulator of protease activity HflC (stomatin/prohibitin superfamily)
MPLDTVFKERDQLNISIVEAINMAAKPWVLSCLRCEIRDIQLPDKVVEDMQRQVSAERKKRATILESEGQRSAAVNRAEGEKASAVLTSEVTIIH